jgi:heptaprenyl diphosphate synthase
VIRLQDIRQKYTDIRVQVENKVFDSYLLKYIETPIIDEDKLLILISLMDRLELSFKEMQNFALSTMLIQIALDTHEHITHSSMDEKSRQLTVLAGDYFSGLYYKLLADSEDIGMIRALSYGVKDVNEHKVAAYQKESGEIEKIMNDLMMIESSLIAKLAEYFKVDLWNEFIANFLLFKRLVIEKRKYVQDGSSGIFDLLKKVVFPKNDSKLNELSSEHQNHLLMVCDHYLEISKHIVEKGIRQLPYLNDLLEKRISTILNQHQPIAKTFVEEG